MRALAATLTAALAVGVPSRAQANTCAGGPGFWQIQRAFENIGRGTVVEHVPLPGQTRGGDVVLRIDEVLRGRIEGPTVMFRANGRYDPFGGGDIVERFPLGTEYVFAYEGFPGLGGCGGAGVLQIGDKGVPSLAEIRRRVRHRGVSRVAPKKTPDGRYCGAMLETWVTCANLRVREYLENLRDYEAGMDPEPIQLSDREWDAYGDFAGRVPGLERGFNVYLFAGARGVKAYTWVEPGAKSQSWPACTPRQADSSSPNVCRPVFPFSDALHPSRGRDGNAPEVGAAVRVCNCVPDAWLKRLGMGSGK